MKPISFVAGAVLMLQFPLHVSAAAAAAPAAMVRITCEDADKGAEVMVDGKFKGECPVDIMLPEGTHKFRVVRKFDDTQDRVFEQEVRLGGGTSKKIDVVLSGPQMNAAARRAADAANSERYKKAEAALTKLIQQANSGEMEAKKELASNYVQDTKGCYFYTPIFATRETVTWTGGCRNGLTAGSGEWSRSRDGAPYARYVGAVVAGKEEGRAPSNTRQERNTRAYSKMAIVPAKACNISRMVAMKAISSKECARAPGRITGRWGTATKVPGCMEIAPALASTMAATALSTRANS